jgi:secernin
MCDTAVALPNVTRDQKTYFAKNSDREPNEAQYLEIVKGAGHQSDENVKCTYIEIPQAAKTYTVLLSRPFWMWGAEMGVNENGVAIGNEAVFTKLKPNKQPGLIGMDFLRLALERSASAEEALHVIIALLEKYGQSGNCSREHGLYYHNSFLIADRREAWVLETADKQWAALKVQDFYSISNRLTIGTKWDLASEDLVRLALDQKWCKSKADFHFADCYSDFIYSTFSGARSRRSCSYEFLKKNTEKIDLTTMFTMLRQHAGDEKSWRTDSSLSEWTVCVHKGFGPIRSSQTTGSLVCRLSEDGDLHFATGTSTPCLSLFKPIWLDSGLPQANGPQPSAEFDQKTLWWQHELLHREVLKDFPARSQIIRGDRDSIEKEWMERALHANQENMAERQNISEDAFEQSSFITSKWIESVKHLAIKKQNTFYYDWEWRNQNRKAKISI